MNLDSILDCVENLVNDIIGRAEQVTAESLGLDPRAGYSCDLYVIDDAIIADGCVKNLNYYGGFEYVDSSLQVVLGTLTIYSEECDRVQEHIATYRSRNEAA
jgi:hypothetical protein